MLEVVMMGLFFVFGYLMGFIVGAATGKRQGIREQSLDDMEYMRLKQIEWEESGAEAEQDEK